MKKLILLLVEMPDNAPPIDACIVSLRADVTFKEVILPTEDEILFDDEQMGINHVLIDENDILYVGYNDLNDKIMNQ